MSQLATIYVIDCAVCLSYTIGCEAIINGPLNSEGIASQLSTMDTNATNPAVVRCLVSCLDRQRIYYPAMALIITSQELFVSVRGPYISSSRDGLYEIHYRNVSSCEAQNNYTMEFEYLLYSNSSSINRAVVICGVIQFSIHTPCWGQSYGIIRYNSKSATTTHTVANNSNMFSSTSSVPSTTITSASITIPLLLSPTSRACALSTITPSAATIITIISATSHAQPVHGSLTLLSTSKAGLLSLISIPIIALVIFISVSFTVRFKRLHKKTVPRDIEEQGLVMKVELTSEEEIKQQKEKETLIDEAGSPPSTHTELDHKLPDIISSRDSK